MEAAPLEFIQHAEWPRLCSLHLEGDIPSTTRSPSWVSTLQHMPSLRHLTLRAFPGYPNDHQCVWPPNSPVKTLPWPHLERPTVTHPDPEDIFYSHLPPTLDNLSLEHFTLFAGQGWDDLEWSAGGLLRDVPMSSASELLCIVRKCNTPRLRVLRVEYLANDREDELLSCISTASPRLEFLRLCRYSTQDRDDAPSVTLVRLSPLIVSM